MHLIFSFAIRPNQKLRADGGALDYVYTTHAYLVSLFLECPPGLGLHCPSAEARAAFVEGVARGDIVWHAFPFNAQCEWAEPSLLAFGVELAQTLAARHNISVTAGDSDSDSDARSDGHSGSGSSLGLRSGRNGGNGGRPTTMSQRDVPGTTRAMLPLLAAAGVRALSFGANEASAPLIVPQIFRWRDEASGAELLTMYHPSGYGNISTAECVTIDGLDTALAMAFRGDNAGPHSPAEVAAIVAQLTTQVLCRGISKMSRFIEQHSTANRRQFGIRFHHRNNVG